MFVESKEFACSLENPVIVDNLKCGTKMRQLSFEKCRKIMPKMETKLKLRQPIFGVM